MKSQLHIPREVEQEFWTSEQFCSWFFYNIVFDNRLQALEQKVAKRRQKEDAKLAEEKAAYKEQQKKRREDKQKLRQKEVEL